MDSNRKVYLYFFLLFYDYFWEVCCTHSTILLVLQRVIIQKSVIISQLFVMYASSLTMCLWWCQLNWCLSSKWPQIVDVYNVLHGSITKSMHAKSIVVHFDVDSVHKWIIYEAMLMLHTNKNKIIKWYNLIILYLE